MDERIDVKATKSRIGRMIAYYRRLNGLKQSELAQSLGVSDKAVSTWERGRSEPDADTLKKLSMLFDVPVGKFIADADMLEERVAKDQELLRVLQAYNNSDDTTKEIVRRILRVEL